MNTHLHLAALFIFQIQGEKECNLTLNTWANPEVVAFRLNLEGESNGNVHPPIRNSRVSKICFYIDISLKK